MSRSQCEKLVKSEGVFTSLPHTGYAGIRVSLEVAGDYFVRTVVGEPGSAACCRLAKNVNKTLKDIEGRP